ncbi:MAG: phage major capsid protein [Thermomicrobiales bacterium]
MAFNNLTDRTDAGALIPETVASEIIQSLPKQSAALQLMRKVSMGSKTHRMPVLSALPNAYWVTGDTGMKQTDEMAWTNKMLIAEELAVILPVPDAVIDDASFDLWGEITSKLVEAFGIKIDQAVLFGTQKPTSWSDAAIVPGAVAAGNALAMGSIAGKDIVSHVNEAMAKVEDDGFDVNGFAARRRIRSTLRDLRATDGQPIFSDSLHAEGAATIYGEPVRYVDNGAWDDSAAELVAGDWDKAIIGIRQDISYKIFTEGVISDDTGKVILNLMQQDSKAIRAVMRLGFCVANPMNRLNTNAATRYPFSVLTPGA